MAIIEQFTEDELAEVFVYLDELRESGVTNMYGARPYVMREFGCGGSEAATALSAWMKTFGETPPIDRARSALADPT